MVCLLVAAWLAVRALDAGDWTNAAARGSRRRLRGSRSSRRTCSSSPGPRCSSCSRAASGSCCRTPPGSARRSSPARLEAARARRSARSSRSRRRGSRPARRLRPRSACSVDVGRYVDLDWTNFRSNMAQAARVLLERARAPVAAVRGRLRGRAPVAPADGPARRLVRRVPPRQGNAARNRPSRAAASSAS